MNFPSGPMRHAGTRGLDDDDDMNFDLNYFKMMTSLLSMRLILLAALMDTTKTLISLFLFIFDHYAIIFRYCLTG